MTATMTVTKTQMTSARNVAGAKAIGRYLVVFVDAATALSAKTAKQAVYDEDRYPIVGQKSHYVEDTCDFCWEKLNATIDPDQYVDDGKGKYELTAYEAGIDKLYNEHNSAKEGLCERREHLLMKTAFKQWVKKDE